MNVEKEVLKMRANRKKWVAGNKAKVEVGCVASDLYVTIQDIAAPQPPFRFAETAVRHGQQLKTFMQMVSKRIQLGAAIKTPTSDGLGDFVSSIVNQFYGLRMLSFSEQDVDRVESTLVSTAAAPGALDKMREALGESNMDTIYGCPLLLLTTVADHSNGNDERARLFQDTMKHGTSFMLATLATSSKDILGGGFTLEDIAAMNPDDDFAISGAALEAVLVSVLGPLTALTPGNVTNACEQWVSVAPEDADNHPNKAYIDRASFEFRRSATKLIREMLSAAVGTGLVVDLLAQSAMNGLWDVSDIGGSVSSEDVVHAAIGDNADVEVMLKALEQVLNVHLLNLLALEMWAIHGIRSGRYGPLGAEGDALRRRGESSLEALAKAADRNALAISQGAYSFYGEDGKEIAVSYLADTILSADEYSRVPLGRGILSTVAQALFRDSYKVELSR